LACVTKVSQELSSTILRIEATGFFAVLPTNQPYGIPYVADQKPDVASSLCVRVPVREMEYIIIREFILIHKQ
jgi:hypothetical protein